MPIFDFQCEGCGWTYMDVYVSAGELGQPLYCIEFERETEVTVGMAVCDTGEPLVALMAAPAAPQIKVGRHAGTASKREDAHEKKKKMLKRSYNHEFKRGGKGVEERRAHIEELKKKKVPIPGHHGF